MKSIHLILGPMFAGKSTELLRQIRRMCRKHKTILVNHMEDKRCKDEVKTHDNYVHKAVKVNYLKELLEYPEYHTAEVVGIDEGQFYPDLYEFVMGEDKIFIIASLDADSEGKKFGQVLDLFPCESITKLNAICELCGMDAPFSYCKEVKKEQTKVGDEALYIATCRNCRDKLNKVIKNFQVI